MSIDPYLSNVTMFAGNFAPLSWAFCNGALMSIAENTALFSLLGTTYGGDGQTTFALPDLRGRVPMGTGTGPGLNTIDLGEMSGTPTVTLISTNLAPHNHVATMTSTMHVNPNAGGLASPAGNIPGPAASSVYNDTATAGEFMTVPPVNVVAGVAGSSQPVDIMMPYLAINYIIAVEGIYPSRN